MEGAGQQARRGVAKLSLQPLLQLFGSLRCVDKTCAQNMCAVRKGVRAGMQAELERWHQTCVGVCNAPHRNE